MIEALISLGVVFAFGLWMMALARPMRGDQPLHARKFSFLSAYELRLLWPSLIIGALALGTVVSFGAISAGAITAGATLGVITAAFWPRDDSRVPINFAEWPLAAISLWAAVLEITKLPEIYSSDWLFEQWAVKLFVVLLIACYLGGLVLSGGLLRKLTAKRLLVFFAAIDVLVFMVSPGGTQIIDLDPAYFYAYLAVTGVAAFLLGVAPIGIVTAIAAAGVTLTSLVLGNQAILGRVTVVVAALVAAFVVTRIRSRVKSPV